MTDDIPTPAATDPSPEAESDPAWRILYAWYERHKEDRHVSPLFLRSDTVLHRLAAEINAALDAFRLSGRAEMAKLDEPVRISTGTKARPAGSPPTK